jgi:hypothetical protein
MTKDKALAQPEQKYHRGDRLICLETEEYCVIHISGTDRQWVKFPDSHIGVYTNEQVAELFELLPKEPEQEPVAIRYDYDGYGYQYIDSGSGSDWQKRVQGEPLYTAPHPEQYPQIAISPEIVGYVAPQRTWVGLTRMDLIKCGVLPFGMSYELCQAIEAKLKQKNTRGQE